MINSSSVVDLPLVVRKVRISITVNKQTADEIEQHFRKELKRALDRNEATLPRIATLYGSLVEEAWEKRKKK